MHGALRPPPPVEGPRECCVIGTAREGHGQAKPLPREMCCVILCEMQIANLQLFVAPDALRNIRHNGLFYVEHSYDPVLAAVSALVILVTLLLLVVVEKLVGVERVT